MFLLLSGRRWDTSIPLYHCRRYSGSRSMGRRFWGSTCCLGHKCEDPRHQLQGAALCPFYSAEGKERAEITGRVRCEPLFPPQPALSSDPALSTRSCCLPSAQVGVPKCHLPALLALQDMEITLAGKQDPQPTQLTLMAK